MYSSNFKLDNKKMYSSNFKLDNKKMYSSYFKFLRYLGDKNKYVIEHINPSTEYHGNPLRTGISFSTFLIFVSSSGVFLLKWYINTNKFTTVKIK